MKNKYTVIFALILLVAFAGCKKEDPLPPNPYDDVDYGNGNGNPYNPDPNTITGIWHNILKVKCSLPGCHDGTFEPNFSSIQSSWETMVYHEVVKNTSDTAYSYRVIPYDTGGSILWYRVNRGDAQLQQMPATGAYLTATEKSNVLTWIQNGAPDMDGNIWFLPNNKPQITGYLADNALIPSAPFLSDVNNRLDSLPYMPFKVAQGSTFYMFLGVEDDSTAVQDLLVNQLKLSTSKDNFTSATTVNAVYSFGFWIATVPTSAFTVGDTVYMRYYVNDGDHTSNTEFPRDDSDDFYKTYSAFYVTP